MKKATSEPQRRTRIRNGITYNVTLYKYKLQPESWPIIYAIIEKARNEKQTSGVLTATELGEKLGCSVDYHFDPEKNLCTLDLMK